MEGEVALELGMDYGEMSVVVGIGWMYGFHAAIESKDEVVEVKAQSKTIGDGYLLPKFFEAELTSRLLFIVANCPNITRIDKGCTVNLPKEMCSVLCIQVKLDVTCLIDEVDTSVIPLECARPKFSNTPTTDTVGTAAEISLFVRQNS